MWSFHVFTRFLLNRRLSSLVGDASLHPFHESSVTQEPRYIIIRNQASKPYIVEAGTFTSLVEVYGSFGPGRSETVIIHL